MFGIALWRPFARGGLSMTEACQAAYTGQPAPALLPRHAEAEGDRLVAAYPGIPARFLPGLPSGAQCFGWLEHHASRLRASLAAPSRHRGARRRTPRRRSGVGDTRMLGCAGAVEGHAAVGHTICPPPSPGASHSESMSLGPGPCPQRWCAGSSGPARWRVDSRAHTRGWRGGWYAICFAHGCAQACSP